MVGIQRWLEHAAQQRERRQAPKVNAQKEKARKDVARALASLRQCVPEGALWRSLNDDDLFAMRDVFLAPVTVPPTTQPRGGRPWPGKHEAEEALKQCGVVRSDRQELILALGLGDDT